MDPNNSEGDRSSEAPVSEDAQPVSLRDIELVSERAPLFAPALDDDDDGWGFQALAPPINAPPRQQGRAPLSRRGGSTDVSANDLAAMAALNPGNPPPAAPVPLVRRVKDSASPGPRDSSRADIELMAAMGASTMPPLPVIPLVPSPKPPHAKAKLPEPRVPLAPKHHAAVPPIPVDMTPTPFVAKHSVDTTPTPFVARRSVDTTPTPFLARSHLDATPTPLLAKLPGVRPAEEEGEKAPDSRLMDLRRIAGGIQDVPLAPARGERAHDDVLNLSGGLFGGTHAGAAPIMAPDISALTRAPSHAVHLELAVAPAPEGAAPEPPAGKAPKRADADAAASDHDDAAPLPDSKRILASVSSLATSPRATADKARAMPFETLKPLARPTKEGAPAPSRRRGLVVVAGLLLAGAAAFALTRETKEKPAPEAAKAGQTEPSTATEPNAPTARVAPVAEPSIDDMTPKDLASAKPTGGSRATPDAKKTDGAPSKTSAPAEAASPTPKPGTPASKAPAAPEPQAAPPPPAAPIAPPAVALPQGPEFDKSAASIALAAAAGQAAACRAEGDPQGAAKVSITFAPSGRVTQAIVNGPPFAGTKTGGCVANAFRSAHVPPFDGSSVAVSKTVAVR